MRGITGRVVVITLVLLLAIMFFVPNIANISWWPTKDKIKYGLDIQGGLYLVMGVDVPAVLRESTDRLADTILSVAKEKNVPIESAARKKDNPDNLDIEVRLPAGSSDKPIRDLLTTQYGPNLLVNGDAPVLSIRYSDIYITELRKRTIDQSIETIRNRIDEFGVSEPSITAQGDNRILVQLPGIQDATRAKELINRTARLEFRMVQDGMSAQQLTALVADAEKAGSYDIKSVKYSEYIKKLNESVKGKIPPGTIILFGKNENATNLETGKVPYLLKDEVPLAGNSLKDAYVAINQEYNEPYVSLNFNADGAAKFAQLTGENINKNLAIVLDNVVYSAPNIRQKISGGSAQITLGGGKNYQSQMDDAKGISMALRAGALPASLEQLEERTVGPTLGLDSINRGKRASYIGAILVILFMLIYYRGAGIIADVALCINVFLILAVLTALNATLTLPGIAAIALTIGIAVDANVIIFERIREELRNGASYKTAIDLGYDKAFWAIFDSNLCSAMTSMILMHYGTGPVRGFAVTLVIGIFTSMFSAVFVTRTLIDILVDKVGLKKLSV
ncbi:MAG: protein translocase subunit SecD [Oligoflexia bacterium]|nr:protein translocase subunit SecD [Oligoflexia bacterium]